MTKINKNIWKWIVFGLTICLLPVFVNWVMTIPCNWTIEGPQAWIGFWGAYLGAIASLGMAYIAYRQMRIITSQNRPFCIQPLKYFLIEMVVAIILTTAYISIIMVHESPLMFI